MNGTEPWGYKLITYVYAESGDFGALREFADLQLSVPEHLRDRLAFMGQAIEQVKQRPIDAGGT